MNHSIRILGGAALTALTLAAVAPLAWADNNDDATEAHAFLASGTTLAQAEAAAEAQGGGTAMSASWEHTDSGAAVFEVELAHADGTVNTVLVDPDSRKVTTLADGSGQQDGDNGNCAETEDD